MVGRRLITVEDTLAAQQDGRVFTGAEQAAAGMVYEPWHWRYVGVENALAIRASGLSLEEFLALERTKL